MVLVAAQFDSNAQLKVDPVQRDSQQHFDLGFEQPFVITRFLFLFFLGLVIHNSLEGFLQEAMKLVAAIIVIVVQRGDFAEQSEKLALR